jgi:[ribosomal protein S5]-alanine N-acetyltransferase
VPESIATPRLVLIPCSLELAEALPHPSNAEALLGAALPRGWPDQELAGLLELYVKWLRDDPSMLGYGPWIAIAREERVAVGSAGFVGRPKDGELELGYGIAEAHRNRGYATEAAAALLAWGLAQPGVERVIARSAPENEPSTRVLEKIGMTPEGAEGELGRWASR